MSEKQRNEPPVKLTRAEKREIQAIIRKYKGDGKAHSAQASIPYQAMYPDGICRVTANTFSKCIEFADMRMWASRAAIREKNLPSAKREKPFAAASGVISSNPTGPQPRPRKRLLPPMRSTSTRKPCGITRKWRRR